MGKLNELDMAVNKERREQEILKLLLEIKEVLVRAGPCKHESQLTAEVEANDKIHAELKEERALGVERDDVIDKGQAVTDEQHAEIEWLTHQRDLDLDQWRDKITAKDTEIEELKRYKTTHENVILEHGTASCPFCQQDADNELLRTKLREVERAIISTLSYVSARGWATDMLNKALVDLGKKERA